MTAAPLTLRRRLTARPRLGGCIAALAAFWASLIPSLLPRGWAVQGVISGLDAAVAYGIGAGISVLVARSRSRSGRGPLDTSRWWQGTGLVSVVIVVGALSWWLDEQRAQREMVGSGPLATGSVVGVVLIAVLVAVLLVSLGRVVGHIVVAGDRLLARRLPGWAAHAASVGVAVVLLVALTNRLVVDKVLGAANSSFGALDDTTEEGVQRPSVPEQSGGPGSLVPWDSLGFQGRTFAGSATSQEELRATAPSGATVREPIRAYVGLQSAPSAEARAALAVDELERTGAFDRSVLVVATTTGTGWINPVAAEAVERLWAGDTAIVGQQYSYLPSWISFLVDEEKAAATGEALTTAVTERWAELPAEDRPLLVLFGESLGSFGSESALVGADLDDSIQTTLASADAVLWVGPTSSNPIRDQVIAGRDPESPVWQPVVGGGDQVVVSTSADELGAGGGAPVQYVQHPSDPVSWWDMETLWSEPEWLAEDPGTDVPESARWVPFVTWTQTVADLAAGFSTARGHGHNYDDAWVRAWAVFGAPAGTDEARLADIEAALPPG